MAAESRIVSGAELAKLRSLEGVEVERVWANEEFEFPYDPGVSAVSDAVNEPNWAIRYLSIDTFWQRGFKGSGVRVGIIDSGIDASHAAFTGMMLSAFYDIDNQTGAERLTDPFDSGWHGTHCAAILSGQHVDGIPRGIAPEVEVIAIKALNGFSGSVVSVQRALEICLESHCEIVSLSFGWPGLHDVWCDIVSKLVHSGCLVFAGCGNTYGKDFDNISPANYPFTGLCAIGAHDQASHIWSLSGGGKVQWPATSMFGETSVLKPEFVAPGVEIISAAPGNIFRRESGTSMATPQAAGLAACVWSMDKSKSAGEVLAYITRHLSDAGDAGPDARYGLGLAKNVVWDFEALDLGE